VFGRGAAAQRALSMAFEQRLTDKRYEAIVGGAVPDMAGEINLPLIADWPRRPRQMVDMVIGKPSLTRWERLALETGLPGTTRLALFPVTGRSHQLRVHLQAIGHPIVGDELYAPPDIETLAPRLLLHASHLTLPHPATGQAMAFHAPTPF
jgi:tRNA pseudouridine32 synthase/23S rRNA pseudouridine746 synthase